MAYSTIVCMIIFLAMCYVVTNYQQSLLVNLDKEFERSNAIEVNKTKFLTHVNHELRTPLSALLLSVDLLRDSKHEESKDEILRSIDITANHILSILNGVLDSEREEHFNANEPVTEFDPLEVAMDSVAILAAKAESCGVTLKIEPEAGIERHRIGNRVNLRQVLMNLISNSIQHGGGKTTVRVRRSGDALTYEIHDDGQGMSTQARENLFKPYSASMGATGTTGLGLSICKNLVEIKMGGEISVSSNKTGTYFTVTVPFSIVAKSPKSKSPRRLISSGDDPTYIPLHGKSILIVEDDAFNNEKVTKLLGNAKMRPVSVADSNQALAEVETQGPFDYALVDHDLGVSSPLNGVGLTKLIVGQTKVIGYTGNHSSALDQTWRAAGASSVIRKPVQINGILTALLQA